MLNCVVPAEKIGMSRYYIEGEGFVSVTLVKLYDNCVFNIEELANGKQVVILGFNKAEKESRLSKSVQGCYKKKDMPCFKKMISFQTENFKYKVGESIPYSIIKDFYSIDVAGVSNGKGFCGAMKRWHFSGLEASHGVSVSHRAHGSTGQCQDPGRVFKGKKMAGRDGAQNRTIKNLRVIDTQSEDEAVVCIKGSVPGRKGGVLKLMLND